MTDNEYIEQFRREFGIHFSPSELQFAEVFIEEMVAKVQAQERDRIWHEHLGLGKPIREVLSPNNK